MRLAGRFRRSDGTISSSLSVHAVLVGTLRCHRRSRNVGRCADVINVPDESLGMEPERFTDEAGNAIAIMLASAINDGLCGLFSSLTPKRPPHPASTPKGVQPQS